LGGRKGIRPVKTEWWGAGVVVWSELQPCIMVRLMPLPLTVSCFTKIHIGFTFLVPADLGSPGKGPLNGCVSAIMEARQNNAVQYTHIHANTSTKKTQKDVKNSKKEQNG